MTRQFLYNDETKKSQRKTLRNNMPETEKILWNKIRRKQLLGIKFRRQCSVGAYIIDFFSFEKKLAIEIDGDSHFIGKAQTYDKKRTEFLKKNNIQVIRFTNVEIVNNLDGCLEKLFTILDTSSKSENNIV